MDPTRLIHEQSDGFERDLLDAARKDEPPSGAVMRGAAVLGLAATSVSITATTAGTASAASVKASSAVFGTAALAKWVGIGAAVGVVATSGVRIMTDPSIVTSVVAHDRPASNVPVKRIDKPRAAAEAPAPPALEPTGEPAVAPSPEPVAPQPAAAPNASTKNHGSAPTEPVAVPPLTEPAPPSLAAELAALERGRRALLLHRPNDALRALDDYSAAKKTSVFVAEAQLLRIEALLQAGQRDRAVRLAEEALEQSPNGSHAARLREIVGVK